LIDPVQAVVSVVGVSLIVGLVWLAAGSETARVGDAAAVRERLARELPGFSIGALVVDRNGRAAVARSRDGAELALLFATGKRVTCWSLPSAIARAHLRSHAPGNAVLELDTGDFTRPHLKLELADPESAEGLLALS
jgi:hypothetical protein